VALHIDGRAIDARVAADHFRSELVLARHLKATAAGIARGTGVDGGAGVKLQLLDGATSLPDAFLESIKREKHEAGKKIVLLLEKGTPILDDSHPGMLAWNDVLDDTAAIAIGNHHGFPASVEEVLLSISDHVFSIGVDAPRDATGEVSYLGSHVITFVQMFIPPAK
jgi:tRNA pseudouridine-54 N-methylase